MSLQSQLFRGDPKLEAAVASDLAHVVPGAVGPHVGRIQLALIKTDGAAIAQDSRYGPATAAAVRAFKQKRKILNSQGKIDDIVGKKTIVALDTEMLAKERSGGSGSRGLLGFKVGVGTIADIVVKFQGAFSLGTLTPDSVLSGRRIEIYKPMPNQRFGNTVMMHPFNGRALLRIGRKTTTIGGASFGVFAEVTSELLVVLGELGLLLGDIFIHGSSSGGRNAIDFSASMTRGGLAPHFVSAVDAAFFQADTTSRPEANIAQPTVIPAFSARAGSTPNRHNFFQTIGNHAKLSNFRGILFSSGMAGEEIHGTVAGFRNSNLSQFLPRALMRNANDAHGECIKRGTPETERLIADELLLRA